LPGAFASSSQVNASWFRVNVHRSIVMTSPEAMPVPRAARLEVPQLPVIQHLTDGTGGKGIGDFPNGRK
jgi:hypothetical protein